MYINKTLKLAATPTKLLANTNLVRSTLENANIIWFNHTKNNIAKLENIQRIAVRFILKNTGAHIHELKFLKSLVSLHYLTGLNELVLSSCTFCYMVL